METLLDILETLEYAMQLASIFIWLAGYYLLYLVVRLRLILWLIAAEAVALIYNLFNGIPSLSGEAFHRLPYETQWWVYAAGNLMRFTMVSLYLIGGVLAVIYLQNQWRKCAPEEAL